MKKLRETSVGYLTLLGMMGAFLSGCDHPQSTSSSKVAQGTEKPAARTVEQMLAEKGHMNEDLKQGVELLLAGNYQEASKSFNLALFKDQTNGWIHYLNGLSYQLHAKNGDITQYDLAQAAFEQALKYDPNNMMASLQLARVFTAKKDYAKAQEELANVLIMEPNNKDAAYELAYVSYQRGDVKSASMAINRASQLSPQNAEVRRAEAMILAASGKGEKALEQLAQYQNLHKGDAETARTRKRVEDWNALYKNGLVLAQAEAAPNPSADIDAAAAGAEAAPDAPTASTEGQGAPDGSAAGAAHHAAPAPKAAPAKAPQSDMIFLDAVVLRVSDEGTTTKGNNILDGLNVSLSPGSYGKGWSKSNNTGGGSSQSFGFLQGTAAAGAITGSGINPIADGLSTTRVFTQGVSFSTLNYSLKIANAERNYVEVVGRPSLVASVGKPATFFSGRELTLGLTGQNGGTIQKVPVGTTLKVTPSALEGNMVTLDIALYGSLITDNTFLSNDPTQRWTDVGLSKVTTNIQVALGETIMLGGISERIDIQDKSGFPVLQDIPGVQLLFSQETTDSQRKSVMYLITPRSYLDNKKKTATITISERGENMTELERRNQNWFDPANNTVVILKSLSPLYREFRHADLPPMKWDMPNVVGMQVEQALSFIYY
jgi:tetratricopeptide (TPR) repeat protein